MKRRSFTLVEALIVCGMLAIFLNGVLILSGQVWETQKRHRISAAQTATESLLAIRWREFAQDCEPTAAAVIEANVVRVGDREARIESGAIWIGGVLTPVGDDVTATFSRDEADPDLMILDLRVAGQNADQDLRIVARRSTKGVIVQ